MVNRISNPGVFVLVAILIFVVTISGCRPSKFILVQSRVVETTKSSSLQAEVTTTPSYLRMVSKIHSVAVRAPSSCADQAASSATGSAEGKGVIVSTRCGVEMAEIERALARQGFAVYSWDMVNREIIAHPRESAATVARRLGAQVLFQVNSLERVIVTPGRDASIERNFFSSNEFGETVHPLRLNEQQIKKIKVVTGWFEEQQLLSAERLGAMLDINAVDTDTSQTIWFYRWSKPEDTSKNIVASFLLQCWDHWEPWCLIEKKQDRDNPNKGPEKSTEVETLSTQARPVSEQDAIYFGLLRDVTADFVKRFSSGQ